MTEIKAILDLLKNCLPRFALGVGLLFILPLLILVYHYTEGHKTQLERVMERGELIVITRNSPTTYYQGPYGPQGFEYDLLKAFADSLGVELKVVIPDRFQDVLPMIAIGKGHLAAAGLTVTEDRKKMVRFTPPHSEVTQQLVYRRGDMAPTSVNDLAGKALHVIAGTTHEASILKVASEVEGVIWESHDNADTEELLSQLWAGEISGYVVSDSNEIAIQRPFYPDLRIAFDLGPVDQLAWAFPYSEDTSLFDAASDFIIQSQQDGLLAQLQDRYYSHIEQYNYVETRYLMEHIQTRLSKYKHWYMEAGDATGLDWRLLAAVGYQESHWRPNAISPTGVRGIMMLTQQTAEYVGVTNRLDPKESIMGGARYLASVMEKIPERIGEPDRTWMALAAYNVGFGHLEDARKLTEHLGRNPDRWMDVKETLPLLSRKQYYKFTRHGYARGREPVQYVENIRSYFDILNWMDNRDSIEGIAPPAIVDSDSAKTI